MSRFLLLHHCRTVMEPRSTQQNCSFFRRRKEDDSSGQRVVEKERGCRGQPLNPASGQKLAMSPKQITKRRFSGRSKSTRGAEASDSWAGEDAPVRLCLCFKAGQASQVHQLGLEGWSSSWSSSDVHCSCSGYMFDPQNPYQTVHRCLQTKFWGNQSP